jgi:hypothetical protein
VKPGLGDVSFAVPCNLARCMVSLSKSTNRNPEPPPVDDMNHVPPMDILFTSRHNLQPD